jgi:hypothetical protein
MKTMHKILCLSLLLLAACTHNHNDGLQKFKAGQAAAVIGGCNYQYKDNFLFSKINAAQACIMTWQGEGSSQLQLTGKMAMQFVPPGEYEFVAFRAKDTTSFNFLAQGRLPIKHSKYNKLPGQISIFNKITLKPGDVAYIGNLNVDVRKTGNALQTMHFHQYVDAAQKYLHKKQPDLLESLQIYNVDFTHAAKSWKKILN